jgi:hypothetical protein
MSMSKYSLNRLKIVGSFEFQLLIYMKAYLASSILPFLIKNFGDSGMKNVKTKFNVTEIGAKRLIQTQLLEIYIK